MTRIYKLLDAAEWGAARTKGWFDGSGVDLADGFIHFSSAEQLAETARRHFKGQNDLVCLAVEVDALPALRWEPSRGGALFPHLYGALPTAAVVGAHAVTLGDDGIPIIDAAAL